MLYAARVLISKGVINSEKIDFYDEKIPLGKLNKYIQFERYIKKSLTDIEIRGIIF